MNEIMNFFKNKWVKFGIVAILYILFVIWLRSPLWFLGLIIIFDIYITKKVKWAFWKKRYKEGEKHNSLLDWLDAIIFAVVAVTIIRIFFIEAYTIPTPSMEKSLMVGDYLFVSKVSYGPKIPNTPLSLPFMHNVIPGLGTKSYSELIQWDYKRLAGLGKVERNDVVVFNFPHGDTVIAQIPDQDYHLYARSVGRKAILSQYDIIVRPVDKKDNYVKRCVAIPGDSLKIVDGNVFINGKPQIVIPKMQYNYNIETKNGSINPLTLSKMGISKYDSHDLSNMPLTAENVEKMRNLPNVISVQKSKRQTVSEMEIFPFDVNYQWTEDDFGPIWIPQKGATVNLTINNLPLYREIIGVYEKNDLKVDGDKIYINGTETSTYTFKMDYYWMMGDNRHNSADSRYWGFVPEDHIVGKAWFVWFSSDKEKSFPSNIRWSRMFRFIH